MAVSDSSAKNVLILSPVLCLSVWYGMILAFGFSMNIPQLIFMRSMTASPESFIDVSMAFSLWLFGSLFRTLIMCWFVARLTPVESPFG